MIGKCKNPVFKGHENHLIMRGMKTMFLTVVGTGW